MAEIQNLEIKVHTTGAARAVKNLKELQVVLGDLKQTSNSVKEISSNVGNLAVEFSNAKKEAKGINDELEETSKKEKNIKKIKDSTKELGKEAKKSSGFFSKLGSSILRIGFYRLIRAAMKEITEAFKEGFDNLYQWSKLLNGNFAKGLDSISSKFATLKNQMGASFGTLVESLRPAIEWLIDGLTKVFELITIVISALSGKTTYYKATKQVKEYAAAVNNLKKSLAGFDEINNIGGTSGSGNNTITGTEFEEVPLPNWADEVANIVKYGGILGGLALTLKTITDLFGGKNKALKEQTNLTNNDSTATEGLLSKLGVLASVLGVAGLGFLGSKKNANEFKGEIESTGDSVGNFAGESENALQGLGNAIGGFVNNSKEKLKNWGTQNGQTVMAWKELFVLSLSTALANATINFTSFFATSKQNFTNWCSSVARNVGNSFSNIATNIRLALENAGNNIADWATNAWSNVSNWATSTVTTIGSWARTFATNVSSGLSSAWSSFKSYMSAVGEKLSGWFSPVVTTGVVSVAITGFAAIKKMLSGYSSFVPAYDVGTNYVSHDQLAMVHKGEAIIPAKYNQDPAYSPNGSDETNELLRQLIEVVANKDMNAYIDGDSIGKASVNYINRQSRILGGSLL